jgi:hypothetical protein
MKRTILILIFCAFLLLALSSNGVAANCSNVKDCPSKEICVQWLRDCGPKALNCAKQANKDSQLYDHFPAARQVDLTTFIDAATQNMDYARVQNIVRVVKKELAKHILNRNKCL